MHRLFRCCSRCVRRSIVCSQFTHVLRLASILPSFEIVLQLAEEKQRALNALGRAHDALLARRVLAMATSDAVRRQDIAYAVAGVCSRFVLCR